MSETYWQKRVAILDATVMPNPLPEPDPGGGAPGSYQRLYTQKYMWTRNQLLWPFFYGRQDAPAQGTELTWTERGELADKLYKEGVIFDQELDYEGESIYGDNFQRNQIYGYTREPAGTGTFTPNPPLVVNPADLKGPVTPAFPILVSMNIADYHFKPATPKSEKGGYQLPTPYAGC